jgi:hypothetical protein
LHNVKKIDGKVLHPERMSQDYNIRVFSKVSDISVDDDHRTSPIDFSNVELLELLRQSLKV